MQTENMTDEEYNSIIYTKEELEREFVIWKQDYIQPKKINDYINWATTNNQYVQRIENYDIYKKIKSEQIVDYKKVWAKEKIYDNKRAIGRVD